MDERLMAKLTSLRRTLDLYGSFAVAFSGGVDSAFLAKVSHDIAGAKAVAITVRSEAYPPGTTEDAALIAASIGIRHIIVDATACDIPEFAENAPERCYHCKKALFMLMREKTRAEGFYVLIDGSNADDRGDYRPGMRALAELEVKSPLMELDFSKADIRELSKSMELPTWNRQSFACLASRFPYGMRITPELLERTWRAEDILKDMGFSRYRVRNHGDIARIELDDSELQSFCADRETRRKVSEHFKALGFTYVTVDIEGYRTGSMNEVLGDDTRGGSLPAADF